MPATSSISSLLVVVMYNLVMLNGSLAHGFADDGIVFGFHRDMLDVGSLVAGELDGMLILRGYVLLLW